MDDRPETLSGAGAEPRVARAAEPKPAPAKSPSPSSDLRRVLVLQGGGALGSYQAGVYEVLHRHDLHPDWVAGISIGAINAALIAGNPPERRLERMKAFWELISSGPFFSPLTQSTPARSLVNQLSGAFIAALGAPGFFSPRLIGPLLSPPGAPGAISFYDTEPLRKTLENLVDFDLINSGATRLSVGAVHVATGNSVLFDSAKMTIGPEHIMASGALPPGFPPVWIEGEAYWDGGLVSNTPLEFVLDEADDSDLIVFQVDLFNARGAVPKTLSDAEEREKDIRYSSRTRLNTDLNLKTHRARAALRKLLDRLPPEYLKSPEGAFLADVAKENALTVVQLIYRKKPYEGGSKDFEFSRQSMLEHWASGVSDLQHAFTTYGDQLLRPSHPGVVVIDPGLSVSPE
jgi:NTE family protein